jgi:replication factor A1
MGFEEIISKILASNCEIKREEILQTIKKKKAEVGDFLNNETAARIIALELGVNVTKKPVQLNIKIKDLISGLNDVSIIGKVDSIYPVKTFKHKDWTKGKLANITISDESGSIRVVLWDKKADFIKNEKISKEQTVKISHGYVREGIYGKPELHLGDKGNIKKINE